MRQHAQLMRSRKEPYASVFLGRVVQCYPGCNQFRWIERPVRHVLMLRHDRTHTRRFRKQLASVKPQGISEQLRKNIRQLRRLREVQKQRIVEREAKSISELPCGLV